MALSLKISAHSEIGLVRTNNQDSAYVSPRLIVVADGMGGAAAGDLASAVAIRELQQADEQAGAAAEAGEPLIGEQLLETLGGALTRANDSLGDLVAWDHSLEGMGTTVCGAMFSGSQYGICHIGDSRGYLLRAGEFSRLTHDHSWVQSLVDEGKISLAEAAEHPHRSLLLKVLNGQPIHTPDFTLVDAQLGDRLLFCSDGLCGMVDDQTIEKLLANTPDLDALIKALTAAAHTGGGLDNITLIVADVVEYDEALATTTPQILGAAAEVEIPKIDQTALGEASEETTRVPRKLAAPELPAGVIDPDRFEAIRYTPHLPSRRRRLIPWLTSILVVALLATAGYFGGRAYLSAQYYIGPDDQQVALYHGVPEQIFGRPLSTKIETSTIRINDLPPYYAGKVRDRGLQYTSAEAAQVELANLGRMAERCIVERAASASPSASTSGVLPSTTSPTTESSSTDPAGDPDEIDQTSGSPSSTVSASTTASTPASPQTSGTPSATPRPDLEACG